MLNISLNVSQSFVSSFEKSEYFCTSVFSWIIFLILNSLFCFFFRFLYILDTTSYQVCNQERSFPILLPPYLNDGILCHTEDLNFMRFHVLTTVLVFVLLRSWFREFLPVPLSFELVFFTDSMSNFSCFCVHSQSFQEASNLAQLCSVSHKSCISFPVLSLIYHDSLEHIIVSKS